MNTIDSLEPSKRAGKRIKETRKIPALASLLVQNILFWTTLNYQLKQQQAVGVIVTKLVLYFLEKYVNFIRQIKKSLAPAAPTAETKKSFTN